MLIEQNSTGFDKGFPRARILFLSVLCLLTTPLPFGFLVAGRLFLQQQARRGSLVLGLSLGGFTAGSVVSLLAPVSGWVALTLTCLCWILTGTAIGVLEKRFGVAPTAPTTGRVRPVAEILSWVAAALLALLPWALVVGPMLSRWGWTLYRKPSMATQLLTVLLLMAIPLGILVGLVRAFGLRRGYSSSSPILFPLSLHVAVLIWGLVLFGVFLIADELFRIEDIPSEPTERYVLILLAIGLWIGVPLFGFASYLAESRGVRRGILRCLAVGGLALGSVFSLFLTDASTGTHWHVLRAESSAESGHYDRAVDHWNWVFKRSPLCDRTPEYLQIAVRDALLAESPSEAQQFLARVNDDSKALVDLPWVAPMAQEFRLTPTSLQSIRKASIQPIQSEEYLGRLWSPLLTAVRSARPDLEEGEIKRTLQQISMDPDSNSLPSATYPWAAETVAGLFELEVLGVQPTQYESVLSSGLPILASRADENWQVVWWMDPEANSMITLNYDLWDFEDSELNSSRLSLEISKEESNTLLRLAKLSRPSVLPAPEGVLWTAIVLVPKTQAAEWHRRLPKGRSIAEQHAIRTHLAVAFNRGASRYVRSRLDTLENPAARQEFESLLALAEKQTTDSYPEQLKAALSLLFENRATSSWYVTRLQDFSQNNQAVDCDSKSRLLDARQVFEPDDDGIRSLRLSLALARGSHDEAADLALSLVRSKSWDSETTLKVLQALSVVPNVGDHPRTRDAISTLADSLWPILLDSDPMRLSAHPAYWASLAALDEDPSERTKRWSRAVELAPNDWKLRARFADSLEVSGDPLGAERHRRTVLARAPAPRCGEQVFLSVPEGEGP